jgi:hypothetical protein
MSFVSRTNVVSAHSLHHKNSYLESQEYMHITCMQLLLVKYCFISEGMQ